MLTVQIPDHLAKYVEDVAQRENRSVDEVVASIIEHNLPSEVVGADETVPEKPSALDALMGMFDDDITDTSTTVKETLREYFKNKTI